MEMTGWHDTGRAILDVAGPEAADFLQGLITNDIKGLDQGAVYAALLTPQGKYLFDFFLIRRGDSILVDVAQAQAAGLQARLGMYRLRAKVTITASDLIVLRGTGAAPAYSFADPRHATLGWRAYMPAGDYPVMPPDLFDAARIAACVPETGAELIPNDSYILEQGFERLNGVNFRKGCYVGQEVTARMKHKAELRKGLARVRLAAPVPPGTKITCAGKVIGQVYSQAQGRALAYLRFDQAGTDMRAAGVAVEMD